MGVMSDRIPDHYTQPVPIVLEPTGGSSPVQATGTTGSTNGTSAGTAPTGQGPGTAAAVEAALNQYLTNMLKTAGQTPALPAAPGHGATIIQPHNGRPDGGGAAPRGGVPLAAVALAAVAAGGGVFLLTRKKGGKK